MMINVTLRASDIVEGLQDERILADVKAGIADLFAFALSDISQCNLRPYELRAIETLCDLNELINELAKAEPEASK